MMFIREALPSDMDGILEGARQFFDYAGYADRGLPLDESSFQALVSDRIRDPNGIVLLLMDEIIPAGAICGSIVPFVFNQNIKLGVELFYWVFPKYRGSLSSIKLLSVFEQACRKAGAQQVVMFSIPTDLQSGVERLYERRGYRPLENFHIKRIV